MKLKWLPMVGVVALALFACQPTLSTGPTKAPVSDGTTTGKVRISITGISPLLAKALGLSLLTASSSARTMMVVTSVDLELWIGGSMYDSRSVPVDLSMSGQAVEPIEWAVPAATGYTAHAKLYNGHVSTTNPVLYGVSVPFDVTSGQSTDVTIYPIPDGAVTVPPGTIPFAPNTIQTSLGSCTATDDPQVYNWGEEKWFQIDATSKSAILVSATGDSSSAVFILSADENGHTMGMALSGGVGNNGPAYWTPGGTARLGMRGGGMRYIGLVTFSDTPLTSDVTLSYEDWTDLDSEPNNSMAQAVALSANVPVNGTNLDPVSWDQQGPPTGGDWFKFTADNGGFPNDVAITLTYDADWSPLQMQLFDSTGSSIASSPPSALSGPENPPALETAQISATVDDGTYYVWVASGGPFLGSTYTLKYISGVGTGRFFIQ